MKAQGSPLYLAYLTKVGHQFYHLKKKNNEIKININNKNKGLQLICKYTPVFLLLEFL